MHAFRDVLIAALQTRKPLSILPFTKHKKDFLTKNSTVPPGIRMDLPTLCQYINLKPALTGSVETVIYMVKGPEYRSGIYSSFRDYVENYGNFSIDQARELEWLPNQGKLIPYVESEDVLHFFKSKNLEYNKGGDIIIDHAIEWIYADTVRAIDAGGVYRLGNSKRQNSIPPKLSFPESRQLGIDLEMLKDVYRATAHPLFIQQLAKEFLSEHKIDEFLGVHFRYNNNDFFNTQPRAGKGGKSMDPLTYSNLVVALLYPKYMFDRLVKYHEEKITTKVKSIFIASPANIATKFAVIGREYKGLLFFTGKDTFSFLEKKRENCKVIDQWFGEVLSELEKQIMVLSKVYFRARPSNWSFNVQGQRFARYDNLEQDRWMYDIFLNEDGKFPSVEELKNMPFVDSSWFA